MASRKNKTTKKTSKKEIKKVEEVIVETSKEEMNTVLEAVETVNKNEVNSSEDLIQNDENTEVQELEAPNDEQSVVLPKDEILEIQEEAFNNTFKENKNNKKLIDNIIGYSWNGQEIEYII